MAFRVGQKVALIAAKPMKDGATQLSKDKVYTIQSFCGVNHGEKTGIHLCEVVNTHTDTRCSCYNIKMFRPVTEQSTDTGMAILRKLLVGGKIEEKV